MCGVFYFILLIILFFFFLLLEGIAQTARICDSNGDSRRRQLRARHFARFLNSRPLFSLNSFRFCTPPGLLFLSYEIDSTRWRSRVVTRVRTPFDTEHKSCRDNILKANENDDESDVRD